MEETQYRKDHTKARGRKKTRQDSDEKMMMLQRMCIEALKCYETSKKSFSLDPSELNHSKLQSSIKVLRRLQTKMTQEVETSSLQNHQNILKYSNIVKESIFKGNKLNTLNAYSNVTLDKDRRKQKQCRMLSGVPDCPADNENPLTYYGIYSTNKELKNMRLDSIDGESPPKQKFFENTYSEKNSKSNKVLSHDKRYYNLPNTFEHNFKDSSRPKDYYKKKLQRLKYSKSEDNTQSSQSGVNFYITTPTTHSQPTTPDTPPHNPSIIAIDDYEFRSEDNTSWEGKDHGYNDVDTICDHIPHTIILLYYLMCNSDPSPLFLVLLTSKLKKVSKKDSIQYLYSIHCIFLQNKAPLKVDVDGEVIESIEEMFECSTPDKVKQERSTQLIKEVHQSSKKRLQPTMKEFESIIQLGLGSLFGDEMLKYEQNVPKKINEIAHKLLLPQYQQLMSENNEYSLCITACLEAFFKLINFQTSTKTPLTTSKSSNLPNSSSPFSKKSSLPDERRTFPPLPPKNINYKNAHSWSSSSFFSSPPPTYNSFSISKFCSMLKEKHRPKIKIRFVKEHHLRTCEYNTPIHCDSCALLVCSVGNYGLECQSIFIYMIIIFCKPMKTKEFIEK